MIYSSMIMLDIRLNNEIIINMCTLFSKCNFNTLFCLNRSWPSMRVKTTKASPPKKSNIPKIKMTAII